MSHGRSVLGIRVPMLNRSANPSGPLRWLLSVIAMVMASVLAVAVHAQEAPSDAALQQVVDLNTLGLDRWRAGDQQGAIAAFSEAIQVLPEWPPSYNHRALARIAAGDAEGGVADAQRSLDLFQRLSVPAEEVAAVVDTRAYAYLRLGQYADARNDFNAAIGLTPNVSPTSPLGRGIARLMLGEEDQGILDLKWGFIIAPSMPPDPELDDLLARAHQALRAVMPSEAPDRFEPDDSPGQANLLPLNGRPQLHSIHRGGDVDWVSFDLEAGEGVLLFTVSPTCDTHIAIYAPDGQTLMREDDDGGYYRDSELFYTARTEGTHYARVRSFFAEDGTCASYQIGGTLSSP